MHDGAPSAPRWLADWMSARGVALWAGADLRDFETPVSEGKRWPLAVSFAIPMNPRIMAAVAGGPNGRYAREYARVNDRINAIAGGLAVEITLRGARAAPLAASVRSDPVGIRGDFPHKTAATRAGLGWIGRHCQLVTRPFGSWVRLGTVFTDMRLPAGDPVRRSYCGRCDRCVAACPAGALTGRAWVPGLPREAILAAEVCDRWKKRHYFAYHRGHNCGICSAVCPWGRKVLRRLAAGSPDPSGNF